MMILDRHLTFLRQVASYAPMQFYGEILKSQFLEMY